MSEALLTSYEELPYESKPLYPTHPDCLATMATLMGMKPAPVGNCRVLELGCATGGNLIPMALTLPGSQFVGIDLSPKQIATGQETVDALRLKNIELRPLSILDMDDSFGQFDYIACHGVYSWVPAAVQDKILDICKRNLAPEGVAYISYNTFPGWHLRAVVREMMGYHGQRFTEPQLRVQQARAFLDFLVQSVPNPESTYHRLLKEEADVLRPAADTYVFHEHLEDANYPVYFWQFMERASAKGLQYLGEAWYHMRLSNLPKEVQNTLCDLSDDLLQLEQYLDFLHNRKFRRTILCHDNVKLNRTPPPQSIMNFYLTGMARPVAQQPDVDSTATEKFTVHDGTTATTNEPMVKAALMALLEAWPKSVPFAALWSSVQSRLPNTAQKFPRFQEVGAFVLAEAILRCYLSNLAALHVHPPQFTLQPGELPLASPLARLQAASTSPITTLRHGLVVPGELDRIVLRYLDGSRNRAQLVETLTDLGQRKAFTLEFDGKVIEEREKIREFLSDGIDACLTRLARIALLIS
ncbi:MAG: methyltransferase regulatory domain-containing protein [Planctomycetes bacterium]|nr:methyltransferase regulatory domain-containing protein [Planctomycetota bacterium]